VTHRRPRAARRRPPVSPEVAAELAIIVDARRDRLPG